MTKVNKKTGEIDEPIDQLNVVITKITQRPPSEGYPGSVRIQQDFSNCPTLAEQHTAHLTDLNYLIKKYKPDELAAYIAAREQYRQEIVGHDFSQEPDLQGAKNVIYQMKKNFEELPEEIKMQFKNHVEFLKFIDNPHNQEKMIKLGLLKPAEIKNLTDPKEAPIETKQNQNQNKNKQGDLKTENSAIQ